MQVDILCVGHFDLIVFRTLTTTNTNPVSVIFVTLAVRTIQSIKSMLNMFISQCTEVSLLVVWLLVLKA